MKTILISDYIYVREQHDNSILLGEIGRSGRITLSKEEVSALMEYLDSITTETFDNYDFSFRISSTNKKYYAKIQDDGEHYTIFWKKKDGFEKDGCHDGKMYPVQDVLDFFNKEHWILGD